MQGRRVALAVCAWLDAVTAVAGQPSDGAAAAVPPARMQRQAQVLDPGQYDAAFLSGAQAEFLGPSPGISSLLFGYDAIRLQVDLSVGLAVGGDPLEATDRRDAYAAAVRLAIPVHRGVRADYSLLAGGGVFLIDAPDQDLQLLAFAVVGARFRVFLTPNVATLATLGVGSIIRGEHSGLILGARPLGAAGVVYFFR